MNSLLKDATTHNFLRKKCPICDGDLGPEGESHIIVDHAGILAYLFQLEEREEAMYCTECKQGMFFYDILFFQLSIITVEPPNLEHNIQT